MSDSKISIPLPHIASMPPYNAGVSATMFEATYGMPCKAKLDSNENPLGPSPHAIEAAKKAVLSGHRYPDSTASALKDALADKLGTTPDHIQVGNGSEELINLIYRSVLSKGHKVITVVPSFGLHELAGILCQAEVKKIPFNADWTFPVERLVAELEKQPRIFVISSPSNPVGTTIEDDAFKRLLDVATPESLVILDEAYVEFLPSEQRDTRLKMLMSTKLNWVVLRTFSKAYGLAGMRVGYAVCSAPDLVHAVKNSGTPFNVNLVALGAAQAALLDEDHLTKSVSLANAERDRMSLALRNIGMEPATSHSNAVFFDAKTDAEEVAASLKSRGVLVKPWKEVGYRSCLRVSVGLPEENNYFLSALVEAC